MTRNYYTEERFTFAVLTKEEVNSLNEIKFDRHFISNEQIKKVEEILNINENTEEDELRAIRNSIVKDFDDMTSISAITCVIDRYLEGR